MQAAELTSPAAVDAYVAALHFPASTPLMQALQVEDPALFHALNVFWRMVRLQDLLEDRYLPELYGTEGEALLLVYRFRDDCEFLDMDRYSGPVGRAFYALRRDYERDLELHHRMGARLLDFIKDYHLRHHHAPQLATRAAVDAYVASVRFPASTPIIQRLQARNPVLYETLNKLLLVLCLYDKLRGMPDVISYLYGTKAEAFLLPYKYYNILNVFRDSSDDASSDDDSSDDDSSDDGSNPAEYGLGAESGLGPAQRAAYRDTRRAMKDAIRAASRALRRDQELHGELSDRVRGYFTRLPRAFAWAQVRYRTDAAPASNRYRLNEDLVRRIWHFTR